MDFFQGRCRTLSLNKAGLVPVVSKLSKADRILDETLIEIWTRLIGRQKLIPHHAEHHIMQH